MRRTHVNMQQAAANLLGSPASRSLTRAAIRRADSPLRRQLSLAVGASATVSHTHHAMLKPVQNGRVFQPRALLCAASTVQIVQMRQLRGSGWSGGGRDKSGEHPPMAPYSAGGGGGSVKSLKCPTCNGPVHPLSTVNRDPMQYLECESCRQLLQSPVSLHDELNDVADTAMTVPIPKQIDEYLRRHVIGQEQATRSLSVHVYNHFKRTLHYPRPVQGAPQQAAARQQAPSAAGMYGVQPTHLSSASHDRGIARPRVHLADDQIFTPLGIHPRTKSQIGAFTVNTMLSEAHAQQEQPPSSRQQQQQKFNIGKETKTEVAKSNIVMLGPSGSGKTLLAKTVAEALDVPFTICDCTTLTAAGYVGEDVDTVIERLLVNADHDVERAQRGIVFLDEIDKITGTADSHMFPDRRDVGGTAVQQAFLRMIEGCIVEVGGSRRARATGAGQETVRVDTANILFIASGAFSGLPRHIRRRIATKSVGFDVLNEQRSHDDPFDLHTELADLSEKEREQAEHDRLMDKVTPDDLCAFGMIPEFVGRFPALISFHAITERTLLRILTEPDNCIVDQYKQLLKHDGVELQFTDGALQAIAAKALTSGTGARSLRSVIESVLHEAMYEVPGTDIGTVIIDEDVVKGEARYKALVRAHSHGHNNATSDDNESDATSSWEPPAAVATQ